MFPAPEGFRRVVRRVKGATLPALTVALTPNRSSRRGAKVVSVFIHDTEGAYAGAVRWLRDPRAQASAHFVVSEDGKRATQEVPLAEKAWAVEDYNAVSDNIEMAGFANKPYSKAQLDATARLTAYLLKKRGLRPVHTGANGGGFGYHSDLGVRGGGHHDPGFTSVQRAYFEAQVKKEYARGGFRPKYAV